MINVLDPLWYDDLRTAFYFGTAALVLHLLETAGSIYLVHLLSTYKNSDDPFIRSFIQTFGIVIEIALILINATNLFEDLFLVISSSQSDIEYEQNKFVRKLGTFFPYFNGYWLALLTLGIGYT